MGKEQEGGRKELNGGPKDEEEADLASKSEASKPTAAATAATWPGRARATLKNAALFLWDLACEHWFLLGVGFAIGFAAAVPNLGRTGGYIRAEWTIKYGAVIVIFFFSGMGLKTAVLLQALSRLPLHLLVQTISLGITPFIGWGVGTALMTTPMSTSLATGYVISAAMPTTVSTNVVFTKQAGGNEAAALINAVIGNVIGIFISPALLSLFLGKNSGQSSSGYLNVIQSLAVTIIAPLVAGQIVQIFLPRVVKWLQKHINFGEVGNICVLLLIWSTFCNTCYSKVTTDPGSIIVIIIAQLVTFLTFSLLSLLICRVPFVARPLRIDRPDAVAVTICGATKTIALGMPLITVLYGTASDVGLLALPLLIYHAEQIILGSFLIKYMKMWVVSGQVSNAATSGANSGGNGEVRGGSLGESSPPGAEPPPKAQLPTSRSSASLLAAPEEAESSTRPSPAGGSSPRMFRGPGYPGGPEGAATAAAANATAAASS